MSTPDDSLAIALVALNPQEKAFIQALADQPELRIDLAEESAGLKRQQGATILKRPHVREAFRAIFATRRERYADIRGHVIQALYALAFEGDIGCIQREREREREYDDEGKLVPASATLGPAELPKEIRACIKKVKFYNGNWDYEFIDRGDILLNLLKHFGDVDKLHLKTSQEKQENVTIVMYGTDPQNEPEPVDDTEDTGNT